MSKPVPLDGNKPRHRALGRLLIARDDIRKAHKYTAMIIDQIKSPDDNLFYPLHCAVTVCYGRPFTSGRGYAAVPACYSRFTDAEQTSLHNDMIKFRNEYIAHSDEKAAKVILIPKGVEVSIDNGKMQAKVHRSGHLRETRHLNLQAFPRSRRSASFKSRVWTRTSNP